MIVGAFAIVLAGSTPAVEASRLARAISTLESTSGHTCVAGTEGEREAARFIRSELEALKLIVRSELYFVEQVFEPGRRVVAENLIVSFGESSLPVLVVVAHFDSRAAQDLQHARELGWRWDQSPAPGADDNASGAAALLELARLSAASPAPSRVRIDLVWSGAEEMAAIDRYGFMVNLGADVLAAGYLERGEDVIGAIAVDMLLRPRPFGASFRVYSDGRLGSSFLAEVLLLAAAAIAPGAEVRELVDPAFMWSDHGSFWALGQAGVLFIEDDFHHPRYHRAEDAWDPAFYSIEHAAIGTEILWAALGCFR